MIMHYYMHLINLLHFQCISDNNNCLNLLDAHASVMGVITQMHPHLEMSTKTSKWKRTRKLHLKN